MRIIANEIKKIFNPINLLIVGIVTFIIWFIFMFFYIEYFPNGQPGKQDYDSAVYMLNTYGTSMDKNEFNDFKKRRDEKVKEATKYLSSNKEYVDAGVSTYDDYQKIGEMKPNTNEESKKLWDIYDEIVFKDNVYLFWELQALNSKIESYENKEKWTGLKDTWLTSDQIQRKKEVINSDDINSPLDSGIFGNYNSLLLWVNMLILISIAIMLSLIFMKDNKNKINYIQYSTKIGRKLFKKKIIAGLISTIIITTIQLGILFLIYKSNNTYMFWNCSINSVFIFFGEVSWFNITFGQYIILSVVFTYILALAFSTITMLISSKVKNYITVIGAQIPILFLIKMGISRPIEYLMLFTSIYVPKYTLPLVIIVSILIANLIMVLANKREVRLDIKN